MIFTSDHIRARVRKQPFVPLRLVLSTNQTYDVRHPDAMLVMRRYVNVALPASDNPDDPEMETRIPLVHITELRDLPVTADAN